MRLGRPKAGAKTAATKSAAKAAAKAAAKDTAADTSTSLFTSATGPAGSGPASSGKHRQTMQATPDLPEGETDHELEAYLAALAPTPSDPHTTDPGKRFGNAQVHQLRLSAEADERLRGLAVERGMSPLSLLHDWVMQRLEWELRGRRR